ncbi:alpha/beta hydrolase family domain-containing protein [Rhizoctonia solani AG-1 IA]|uniref:Alpha/beta hydrolase family domain-containing protein n=1 Tax=Thanatephorus cucumeris (strain AG1-IA) TaxID=983506 RepID=L8WW32_THACA|nr:alpha/beta hydrolase family domain-containing protein [Rhizoctonia solani AG-1 IA]
MKARSLIYLGDISIDTLTFTLPKKLTGNSTQSYGWRHQIKGWSGRGIRLIIPDTIGYHGSSQPTSLEDYSTQRQSDDLEELVHRAGVPKGEKIVVIAHDCRRKVRFLSICKSDLDRTDTRPSLCVPFIPRSPEYVPLEKLIELYPNFQYQAFLASHESTAIMNANVERFIQVMFTSAKQREEGEVPDLEKTGVIENWLKDQSQTVTSELLTKESAVFARPMLNYYRVYKTNYEVEKILPLKLRPDLPKLMVVPRNDPFIPPSFTEAIVEHLENYEISWLDGRCGHWAQLEKPQDIERIVGEWIIEKIA